MDMVKERKNQKRETTQESGSLFNLYLFPPQRFKDEPGKKANAGKKSAGVNSTQDFLLLEVRE